MHLALLTPEWYEDEAVGGIATYCQIVAVELARQGRPITVLAATTRAGRRAEWMDGVKVIPVEAGGLTASAVAGRFREAVGAFPPQRDGGPDRIEAAEYAGVAAYVAEAGWAPPVATRLHTPLALLLARDGADRIYRDDDERLDLEVRQVRASAMVTSPSAWLAREVVHLWRLDRAPLIVPNPVALPDAASAMVGALPAARVLYFGRLEYRKGVLTLAAAVRRWLDRGGKGEVVFAGADTRWQRRSVREQMVELLGPYGDGPTVRILGPQARDAVCRMIDWSTHVVLPSRYENFPYACLEAMARGRPVLATTGSGFDEIIEHRRTGVLVPPDDPAALADALAALAADTPALAEMGRRARSSVGRFAAGDVVARLADAYAAMR